ncbi:MAG: hypothetical protein H0T17_00045 [Propionibacteriales bacterium]|nr:hypothetical protein [Propionibacteriales bacterium]
MSVTLRSASVLAASWLGLAWLARIWRNLGKAVAADLRAEGVAARLSMASFEGLVAGAAAMVLLVVLTGLAVSASSAALDGLATAITSRRVQALARVSRSSGPAWWRRGVLMLCGAGVCAYVGTTASYAGEHDPSDVCQVACADVEGLLLPDLPARTVLPPAPRPDSRRSVVVVEVGDCLWDISRHELGPSASDTTVAARVESWYAHNRAILGPDPDLIFPGTHLDQPEVHT